jgi:hypothetical protein
MNDKTKAYLEGAIAFDNNASIESNPYDARRAGASRQAAYDWERGFNDARNDKIEAMPNIGVDDVLPGTIVAEMHMHTPQSGILKDWVADTLFEISTDMYAAMRKVLVEAGNVKRHPGNKYAEVVSVAEGLFNDVTAVMVIYEYDHVHYITKLTRPAMS